MTVESCIMAALFSMTPPLSSSLIDGLEGSEAPPSSQEGGGASHSAEGEGQENTSGNEVNHKSLRHHVSWS